MKKIETTRGNKVLVDDEDYPVLSRWSWSEAGGKVSKGGEGYAYTKISGTTIYLHKLIMGSPGRKNFELDHKNRNILDNRKENLRWISHRANLMNAKKPKDNTSGFKGVRWKKGREKWAAYVGDKFIGHYEDKKEAIKARKKAAKEKYGDIVYHGK